MRRSPRFVVASGTAVVVGLGTAYTVATDLAALHRRAGDLGPERSVLVATHDIALGSALAEDDVTVVHRPESMVPADAAREPDVVVGRTVAVPVVRDAVLQAAHLVPPERDGLDGLVPPGRRAVRIEPVDRARPEPGTVVDVLAALDPGLTPGDDRATAVARGARVLSIGEDSVSADGGYDAGPAYGVTLLVTQEEAYDLAFAAANGVLTLAVAPPEDACCTSSEP
jgi:Flp pilus assembly protein CpaB